MIHVTYVDTETGEVRTVVGYEVAVVVREGPDDMLIFSSHPDREDAVEMLEEATEWLSVVGFVDDPEA